MLAIAVCRLSESILYHRSMPEVNLNNIKVRKLIKKNIILVIASITSCLKCLPLPGYGRPLLLEVLA